MPLNFYLGFVVVNGSNHRHSEMYVWLLVYTDRSESTFPIQHKKHYYGERWGIKYGRTIKMTNLIFPSTNYDWNQLCTGSLTFSLDRPYYYDAQRQSKNPPLHFIYRSNKIYSRGPALRDWIDTSRVTQILSLSFTSSSRGRLGARYCYIKRRNFLK